MSRCTTCGCLLIGTAEKPPKHTLCTYCALENVKREHGAFKSQLEWLWKNCRIVYFPKDEGYPIEHVPYLNKDMRSVIEMEMRKAIEPNYAASFGGDEA